MYIVECITACKGKEDELTLGGPVRAMMGPFDNFDDAHAWMETEGRRRFDTILIHRIQPREKLT